MSRCRACDAILTGTELVIKNPFTYEYEDICNKCKLKSKNYLLDEDEDLSDLSDLIGWNSFLIYVD